MEWLQFTFGIIASIFGLLGFAASMRVLVDLLKAGPQAAEDAFASGASLSRWWNGTHSSKPKWLR